MLQKKVEQYKAIYSAFPAPVRREELKKVKKREEAVSTFCFFLVAGTLYLLFFSRNDSLANALFGRRGLEHLIFPLLIFVEVALARTSKSIMPLVYLLATSLLATVVTYGAFVYFIIYSIVFAFTEMRLIAMQLIPGYPMFEEESQKKSAAPSPEDIFLSDHRKAYDVQTEPENARTDGPSAMGASGAQVISREGEIDELIITEDTAMEDFDDTKEDR